MRVATGPLLVRIVLQGVQATGPAGAGRRKTAVREAQALHTDPPGVGWVRIPAVALSQVGDLHGRVRWLERECHGGPRWAVRKDGVRIPAAVLSTPRSFLQTKGAHGDAALDAG